MDSAKAKKRQKNQEIRVNMGMMIRVVFWCVVLSFAFLMQGRAHGAEYEVKIGTIVTEQYDMFSGRHEIKRFDYEVAGILLYDKGAAYDLAYALNRAHEERTRPPRKPCFKGDLGCGPDGYRYEWPAK